MNIQCKPPERWYLTCKGCNRAFWHITGYPGKDYESGLSSSWHLFYDPQTLEFRNHIDICPFCKQNVGFDLEKREMTILEIFQVIDFLIEAKKKIHAGMVEFNKVRVFVEPCHIRREGYDKHYEFLKSIDTYIDGLIEHVGNKRPGFSY